MEVLLTGLAVLGCIAMMGAVMVVLPRIGRGVQRSPRAQRLMSRLRRQSPIDRVLSWVEDEQPDLQSAVAPDGTVTILFTDIENSTELNERLGDAGWFDLLRAHNRIVRDCVREHGGYEVKAQGDGFMIAYPSAREALECAIAMERHLASADRELSEPLRVRIGIHTGEAIKAGDDFYGRSVTLAARIGDEAKGGEILASSVVRELVNGSGDVVFEDAGELELRDFARSSTSTGSRGRTQADRDCAPSDSRAGTRQCWRSPRWRRGCVLVERDSP